MSRGRHFGRPNQLEQLGVHQVRPNASLRQFVLLQDPSARHLRDTCWPCSRLAVKLFLLRGKLAVFPRPCIQAVFCALPRAR